MASWYERTDSSVGALTGGWLFESQGTAPGTGGLNLEIGVDTPLDYDTYIGVGSPVIFGVMRPEYVLFTVRGKAVAAETGTVTFNFVGRCDESDPWPTVTTFTITLTLAGTVLQVKNAEQLLKAYSEIKLQSITTTATENMEGVNCKVSWKI